MLLINRNYKVVLRLIKIKNIIKKIAKKMIKNLVLY